jgi:hypothetical protein
MGRRHEDDDRQIKRWLAMKRHVNQMKKNCMPCDENCRRKQRQALLHWHMTVGVPSTRYSSLRVNGSRVARDLPNRAAGLGFEPRVAQIQSLACYHYTTPQLYSGPCAVWRLVLYRALHWYRMLPLHHPAKNIDRKAKTVINN